MYPESVVLPRPDPREIDLPNVISGLLELNGDGCGGSRLREKAELYSDSVLGK
jgi:hypothetical protein